MKHTTRRHFLKEVALLSAAAGAFPFVFVPKARAQWSPGTRVHPQIDNLRVVTITDPAMIKADSTGIPWARQEELVNTKTVWEDMDRLACALAQTKDPEKGWKAIFIKPPGKSWSDTVFAIKTNHISQQHTRSAVMSKCCRVATEILGVKPSNVHIYDACHGSSMAKDTPFSGLPEGVRVENTWGGSNTPTPIPKPWGDGSETSRCIEPLVKGAVDILVNISMCKGHSSTFGGFTLTMKNHFGTFDPSPGHRQGAARLPSGHQPDGRDPGRGGSEDREGALSQTTALSCGWALVGERGSGRPPQPPDELHGHGSLLPCSGLSCGHQIPGRKDGLGAQQEGRPSYADGVRLLRRGSAEWGRS